MRIRLAVALVFLVASLPAQGGDFEAPCPLGQAAATGCPPELWTTAPGTTSMQTSLFVQPAGSGINGPISGFPSTGMQWGIVNAANGQGSLTPPAGGGPAPYPLVPGSTGNLRFVGVPVPPVIIFDWNYVNAECPSDSTYNDFFTVDIVDASTGLPLANVLYRDTFSTNYDPAGAVTPDETGVVPGSFCAMAMEEAPNAAVKTVLYSVPGNLVGMLANIEFHVGNATDNAFAGYFYIDNVQLGGGGVTNFQLNQPQATATVNGVLGTVSAPAVVTVPINGQALVGISSTLFGNTWEVGIGAAPLAPASGGGTVLSDGQILNLDLADPTLVSLFNPPFSGPPFFSNISFGVNTAAALSLSFQFGVVDPSVLSGLRLSQANRLVVQ